MAGVPGYCPYCGAIFQSPLVDIVPGGQAELTGNTVDCPNCHRNARVLDGVFEVSADDVLTLTSGPPISKAVLEHFSRLVDLAAKNRISADALQETANQLDPALGKWVSRLLSRKGGITALVIIMMFLRSCSFKIDASLDINRLFERWTGHGARTVYSLPQKQSKQP